MGKYSKARYEGQRAGSDKDKICKEIKMGRDQKKSSGYNGIIGQKKRLAELHLAASEARDLNKREDLCNQFANLASSCRDEVFAPTEMNGIILNTDLDNAETLQQINRGSYGGRYSNILPLHHLAKLLAKSVSVNGGAPHSKDNQIYAYLVGQQGFYGKPREIDMINLRALEGMLLMFSSRMKPMQTFELEINGKNIQVPYGVEVDQLMGILKSKGIRQSTNYFMRRINDGGYKVDTNLELISEEKMFKDDTNANQVLPVSYLLARAKR